MQFIQDIIANSQWPVLTAFLLGLAVALHPCPLAANIAAMGYIARDVNSRRKVFFNSIYYTIGRVLAYTLLGIIIIAVMRNGMNTLHISDFFSLWGERILGPVLIIIGLYFIFSSRLHKEEHCPHLSTRRHLLHGWGGSLLLGILRYRFVPKALLFTSEYSCPCQPNRVSATAFLSSSLWLPPFLHLSWHGALPME